MVFKGSMRPEQLAPANAMFDALDKIGGGVISLQCGGGNSETEPVCLSKNRKNVYWYLCGL